MADKESIAALVHHPGWPALREHAAELMEAQFSLLAKQMMAGKEITPERVAYLRGWFAGVKNLLDDPYIQARSVTREIAESNGRSTVT